MLGHFLKLIWSLKGGVRMFQLAAARSNYYALEAHLLLLLMAFAFAVNRGGVTLRSFFN